MAQVTSTTMPQTETIQDFVICSICHGDLRETVTTSCGHRYCLGCIREWLDNSTTCPCCNNQLRDTTLIQDRQFDSFIEILKIELQKHKETTEEKETLEAELTSIKDKELLARRVQTLQKHLEKNVDLCQQEKKIFKDEIASKEQCFKKEKDIFLQQLSSAQAEIKEKDQQLKEAEKKLENEQNLTRLLREDLEKTKNSCKLLEAHVEFLQGEMAMLKTQLETLKHVGETCRLLEEKFTDIEQDRRSLIGEIGRTSSENQELHKQEGEYKWALMRSKYEVSQYPQLKLELAETNESKKIMRENNKSLQMKIERLTEDLYKKEQNLTLLRHFMVLEQ